MKKIILRTFFVLLGVLILYTGFLLVYYLKVCTMSESVPAYNRAITYDYSVKSVLGVQGKDMTDSISDLSGITEEQFSFFTFDTKTIWPDKSKMPKTFTPNDVLAAGMIPGLGISKLHEQGIDGSGITVAIIDKPILFNHNEFNGRMEYLEVFPDDPASKELHFHGMACASILAGEKCGVANKSTIYYFAVPDNGKNIKNYTEALKKLMEVNSQLASNDKIKVVSISDGTWGVINDNASKELIDTIKRVEDTGVSVIDCTSSHIDFMVAGCPITKDKDDADNYNIGIMMQQGIAPKDFGFFLNSYRIFERAAEWMLVPGDYRSTASNNGVDAYAYWGEGGQSWACPYLAGVIALGKQVNPGISNQDIYDMINETAEKTKNGLKIISPIKFIEKAGLKD